MRTVVVPVLLSMMCAWSASLQSQPSSGPVVLHNIRVVDGTGSAASTNQTIVIDGTQIVAVGDNSRVQVPRGATELDLSGPHRPTGTRPAARAPDVHGQRPVLTRPSL